MQIFWLAALFILGSIVGSFLNVCIYRLPRDKSPWSPARSYCPHCHEVIPWYDNIPLVSWLALSAQCRQCGSYISPRYFIVELLTAVVFAVSYAVLSGHGATGEALPVLVVYLLITCFLIMASFIDLELRIIPNAITVGGILLAPVVSVLVPGMHNFPVMGRDYVLFDDNLFGSLTACVVGMAVGSLATWLSGVLGKLMFKREAMGFGDVKFMAALGGLLGWKLVLLVFFTAPLFGAVVGLIHLARTGDHHIPYGPFLSIAAFVAMLWGGSIFQLIGVTRLLAG